MTPFELIGITFCFFVLFAIRGRWMKNIWFESALLAALVLMVSSLAILAICPKPTTTIQSTETPYSERSTQKCTRITLDPLSSC